ncbi:MAG TPA: Ig-like domain-containing protein [Polyangiales bacterium]|nr:Ig-like domain-containing protein [Polyangiales bacterium]
MKRVILLLAVLCRCQTDDSLDSQLGDLGRVSFSYQRSCFFGCPLAQPLLSGTREQIAVTGAGDGRGVHAKSSDADVAEFALERDCFCERDDDVGGRIEVAEDARCEAPRVKHCDNAILVQAKAAGDVSLELRDEHDRLIDRATLLVRDAERARFRGTRASQLGAREADSFELRTGETLDLELTLFDARGRALLAPEAVHWQSSEPSLASVSAFLRPGGAELDAGLEVVVTGRAAGTATVRVTVPGLEASVECEVR